MTDERRNELKTVVQSLMAVGVSMDDCYALEECIDKAYKADLYRWHDLRKDPEDLPENGRLCLVKTLDNARMEYDVCEYESGERLCWNSLNSEYDFSKTYAVAWREIEPLEDER